MRIPVVVALLLAVTSAAGHAYQYPSDGAEVMSATCTGRPRTDLPPSLVPEYCDCWLRGIEDAIDWPRIVSLDQAVRRVGVGELSPADRKTMIAMLTVGEACFHKVLR